MVNNSAEVRLKSEDTTTVHKKRLQSGGYFLNKVGQHKKLVLLPGCTVLKIEASKLLERAAALKRSVELYRLMANCLPTNRMDSRYVRPLSKLCVERRLSKGEWLIEENAKGNDIFFIMDGYCRLTHESINVSNAQSSMVG